MRANGRPCNLVSQVVIDFGSEVEVPSGGGETEIPPGRSGHFHLKGTKLIDLSALRGFTHSQPAFETSLRLEDLRICPQISLQV